MGQFSVDLQRFADKAVQRSNDIVGRVIVGCAQRLDERSPVDTGRFRGNWQLGIGIIPSGETGRTDPSGSETLGTIKASIPDQPAGTKAYLTNNVPYAQRLEEGWSKQAPNGLVALTAMEFQQVVDQAAAA